LDSSLIFLNKNVTYERLIIISFLGVMLYACNSGQTNKDTNNVDMNDRAMKNFQPRAEIQLSMILTWEAENSLMWIVGNKLDADMAAGGEKIYGVKCAGCHKVTEEKLVGPGWLGVTKRYKPEWILNFITNTNEMLNVDTKAQKQLEICLVRMPNQSLADTDARQLLEFMRKNDGVK
jgi:mono/diheme cytochrome c family protein